MLRIGFPVHLEGELDEGAKALLALPQGLFRPLSLGQIDDEADALLPLFVERGHADQHGDALAVLAEILLLERLHRSDPF